MFVCIGETKLMQYLTVVLFAQYCFSLDKFIVLQQPVREVLALPSLLFASSSEVYYLKINIPPEKTSARSSEAGLLKDLSDIITPQQLSNFIS